MKRIHVLIAVRLELKESTDTAASGKRSKSEGARSHSTTAEWPTRRNIARFEDGKWPCHRIIIDRVIWQGTRGRRKDYRDHYSVYCFILRRRTAILSKARVQRLQSRY